MNYRNAYKQIPIDTPSCPAIYYIIVHDKYLYIGQTKNLKKRIEEHLTHAYGGKSANATNIIYKYMRRWGFYDTKIFYFKGQYYGLPQNTVYSLMQNLVPSGGRLDKLDDDDTGADSSVSYKKAYYYLNHMDEAKNLSDKMQERMGNLILDYCEILHIYYAYLSSQYKLTNTSMGGQISRWEYYPTGSKTFVPMLRTYNPKQMFTVFKAEKIKHQSVIENIYNVVFKNGGSQWKPFVLKYIKAPNDIPNWDETWQEFLTKPETSDKIIRAVVNSAKAANLKNKVWLDSSIVVDFITTKNAVLQRIFETGEVSGSYIKSSEINLLSLQEYLFNTLLNMIFAEFKKAKKNKLDIKDKNVKIDVAVKSIKKVATKFVPVNLFVILEWKNVRQSNNVRQIWYTNPIVVNPSAGSQIITHLIFVSARVFCYLLSKTVISWEQLMEFAKANETTPLPQSEYGTIIYGINIPSKIWLLTRMRAIYDKRELKFAIDDWNRFYRDMIAFVKSAMNNPLLRGNETAWESEKPRVTWGYFSDIDESHFILYSNLDMVVSKSYNELQIY